MKPMKRNFGVNMSFCFFFQLVILALFIPVFDIPARADQINCPWLVNEPVRENPGEKYRKAYCYMKLGRFQEGLALLNGLQEQLPLIGDYALYYSGIGEKRTGNLTGATEIFNKILANYPDSGLRKNVLSEASDIYSATGNYEKAENVYRSLYADEGDQSTKSSYLNNIGEAQEAQKKYTEALTTYKQLWVQFPESLYADTAIKKAFQISNSQGIPLLTTESEYVQRAERLFKLSRWGAALKEFGMVSQTGDIRLKVAICKFRLGSYGEASELLSRIASAESLYWTAKISTKLGRDDEASQTYYQIFRLYPQSALAPEALYNGARLYQINSNFEKAIELYDLLLRKYPQSEFVEDGAWNLGWIYYRSAKYREALATFSSFTASSSNYNSSRATYWQARTLEKQRRKAEALAIYENLSQTALPSYYSYLAQRKTGIKPKVGSSSVSTEETVNKRAAWRKERAEFLISLGILEDAALEIKKMEQESASASDSISVSMLYAKVEDFYNSIRVADAVGLPQANRLSYPQGFDNIVKGFSAKYNVDEFIVYSIIREESRFKRDAVSPANALGLMQLIPPTGRSTAVEVGINGYNTDMLYVPRVNIELGIVYFKKVLELFNGNVHLALGSYNAGPNNVAKWIVRFPGLDMDEFVEEIPFQETRNYVRRVLRSYGAYKAIYDNQVL